MSEKKIVRKKKRWGSMYEYTPVVRQSVLSKDLAKEIEKELSKGNSFTAASLANKFNIKVSVAAKILKQYVEDEKLTEQFKNGRLTIYTR